MNQINGFASICMLYSMNLPAQNLSLTPYNAPIDNIVAYYDGKDMGAGNTSLEFDSNITIKSSNIIYGEEFGYFNRAGEEKAYIKRNKDGGQTLRIEGNTSRLLRTRILSTNHGKNAVRDHMHSEQLSIQLSEVTGNPELRKKNTDTSEALHGFPHDRDGLKIESERDDFLDGEYYKTIAIFRGGVFPSKEDFRFLVNDHTYSNHPKLKGRLLEFSLGNSGILLNYDTTYAFLIIIDEKEPNKGFALANHYYGKYSFGHGIRRDGSGKFPPVPF